MKQKLQVLIIALVTIATCQNAQAQNNITASNADGKNLVKINLAAVVLNNYSLQYERAIGSKISAVMGIQFMPKGQLPLRGTIASLIDDPETMEQIDKIKMGSTVFTPEFRLYFGEDVFRGFYLAPFARFGAFSADMPIAYEYKDTQSGAIITQTIPLSGKVNSITGGLMIGAQWKLSNLLYLDWWIVGPHYGTSKGSIKVTKALSADEQAGLREELDNITDGDNPLNATAYVDATGARLDTKGAFAGIRAGICLGFRF